MLSFMLNLKVKTGNEQKAIEALSEIDRQANVHEGCVSFAWYQHKNEPLKFSMVECWENQESLDKHIPQILDIWNDFLPCLDGDVVSTELHKLVQ